MVNRIDFLVGQDVKRARRLKGLAEADCAKILGIDVEYYVGCEQGKHRLRAEQLFALALALSVPISQFFKAYEHDRLPLIDCPILLLEEDMQSKDRLVMQLEEHGAGVMAASGVEGARAALDKVQFSAAIVSEHFYALLGNLQNTPPFNANKMVVRTTTSRAILCVRTISKSEDISELVNLLREIVLPDGRN